MGKEDKQNGCQKIMSQMLTSDTTTQPTSTLTATTPSTTTILTTIPASSMTAPFTIVTAMTVSASTASATPAIVTTATSTTALVTTARVTTAPVTTAPVTAAPVTTAPVTTAPVTTAPVTTAPATTAPVTTASVTTAPVTTASATTAPVTTASATTAPVTTATITTASVTTAPITTASATTAPVTTATVTTAPVTTPPVTRASVTRAPITRAPITRAPVTTAPVTTALVTTAPVTTAPVTTAPVTTAPITTAPVTTGTVTTAPVTTTLVTTAPVTTAPVTTAPITTALITKAPITTAPITTAPITTATSMTASDIIVPNTAVSWTTATSITEPSFMDAPVKIVLSTTAASTTVSSTTTPSMTAPLASSQTSSSKKSSSLIHSKSIGTRHKCSPVLPIDKDKICRDYIWGICIKGTQCAYHHVRDIKHMKTVLKFCHDYQNISGCLRADCTYLHTSRDEQNQFVQFGRIPKVLADRYAAIAAATKSIRAKKLTSIAIDGETTSVAPIRKDHESLPQLLLQPPPPPPQPQSPGSHATSAQIPLISTSATTQSSGLSELPLQLPPPGFDASQPTTATCTEDCKVNANDSIEAGSSKAMDQGDTDLIESLCDNCMEDQSRIEFFDKESENLQKLKEDRIALLKQKTEKHEHLKLLLKSLVDPELFQILETSLENLSEELGFQTDDDDDDDDDDDSYYDDDNSLSSGVIPNTRKALVTHLFERMIKSRQNKSLEAPPSTSGKTENRHTLAILSSRTVDNEHVDIIKKLLILKSASTDEEQIDSFTNFNEDKSPSGNLNFEPKSVIASVNVSVMTKTTHLHNGSYDDNTEKLYTNCHLAQAQIGVDSPKQGTPLQDIIQNIVQFQPSMQLPTINPDYSSVNPLNNFYHSNVTTSNPMVISPPAATMNVISGTMRPSTPIIHPSTLTMPSSLIHSLAPTMVPPPALIQSSAPNSFTVPPPIHSLQSNLPVIRSNTSIKQSSISNVHPPSMLIQPPTTMLPISSKLSVHCSSPKVRPLTSPVQCPTSLLCLGTSTVYSHTKPTGYSKTKLVSTESTVASTPSVSITAQLLPTCVSSTLPITSSSPMRTSTMPVTCTMAVRPHILSVQPSASIVKSPTPPINLPPSKSTSTFVPLVRPCSAITESSSINVSPHSQETVRFSTTITSSSTTASSVSTMMSSTVTMTPFIPKTQSSGLTIHPLTKKPIISSKRYHSPIRQPPIRVPRNGQRPRIIMDSGVVKPQAAFPIQSATHAVANNLSNGKIHISTDKQLPPNTNSFMS